MARANPPAADTPRRVADPEADRVAATRTLLLDTAERLFAEQGFEKVSIRAINAAAGLNPGAVHYHFGSKQGLVAALLEARLMTVVKGMQQQFERLQAADEIDIKEVVRLQVLPLVDLVQQPGRGRLYVQLLARAYLGEWDVEWTSPYFQTHTWARLAARALPHLPYDVVARRWILATNLDLLTLGRPLSDWSLDPGSIDGEPLVSFIAGGLAAPIDGPPRRGSGDNQ